jgi:hypothetical protein
MAEIRATGEFWISGVKLAPRGKYSLFTRLFFYWVVSVEGWTCVEKNWCSPCNDKLPQAWVVRTWKPDFTTCSSLSWPTRASLSTSPLTLQPPSCPRWEMKFRIITQRPSLRKLNLN